jgi:hypothetical protein
LNFGKVRVGPISVNSRNHDLTSICHQEPR